MISVRSVEPHLGKDKDRDEDDRLRVLGPCVCQGSWLSRLASPFVKLQFRYTPMSPSTSRFPQGHHNPCRHALHSLERVGKVILDCRCERLASAALSLHASISLRP